MAEDKALDWDMTEADPDDGTHGGWTVLEDGYYPFTVQKFERGRYEGSQKIPACPMAVLTLKVQGTAGEEATVTQRLFLTERMLWKVGQFMTSLGNGKNEAGKVVVDWGNVNDRTGWLKLKKRSYTNRDGQERETNDVEFFCAPDEHEKAWGDYNARCEAAQASPGAACAPTMQQAAPTPMQQVYAPQGGAYAPQAQPQQQYQQTAMAGMPTPQPQAQPAPWGIQ